MAYYTLESFSAAFSDNVAKLDKANDEQRFVLALVGVITNITASAYGREYLISCKHGKELLNALIMLLSDLPMKDNIWMKLRNLILRTLYNTRFVHLFYFIILLFYLFPISNFNIILLFLFSHAFLVSTKRD